MPKAAPTPPLAPSNSGSPPSSAAAPQTAPAATPTPTPSPTDGVEEAAAFEAARQAIAAASLLDRIQAMRKYESTQLDALRVKKEQLRQDQEIVGVQLAATQSLIESEQERLRALLRAAYRSSRASPLQEILETRTLVDGIVHALEFAEIGGEERALVDRLRTLKTELGRQSGRLQQDADELARVSEAINAKRDALQWLEARARELSEAQREGGDPGRLAIELDILRDLAADQEKASVELQDVVKRLVPFVADPTGTWTWPASGAVSQVFGPTTLALEPPLVFDGVRYPHFHPALDIAASLYAPVAAAADGRVSFVGHFSDGAMVVLVSHAGGYVTMYAHLDDGLRGPTVRVGDAVRAGDVLGSIGLTGVTTGPHLHFEVLHDTTPVDPRALLPAR